MHVPTVLLWTLALLAAAGVGGFLSALITVGFAASSVVKFGKKHLELLAGDEAPHGYGCCCDDEQSELDRAAISDLMRVGASIYNDQVGSRFLRADVRTELSRALEIAETRFGEWIDESDEPDAAPETVEAAAADADTEAVL